MQQPPSQPTTLATASELTLQVAALDGVADRLLLAHLAGPDGYCRGCQLPQAGSMRWPCTLWVVAERARAVQRARRLPRP